MKVLYLSSGRGEDYQRDVLFHGLRTLLGENAVDVKRIASLYHQPDDVKADMYGHGYTVYANLPEITVDRERIEDRLSRRYFDVVIYGSIHRCAEYLPAVQRHYPPSRIVYVDGEDETRVIWSLVGKGIYFKRELLRPMEPFLRPIHFAVPQAKFISDEMFENVLGSKIRAVAHCDPRDRSTYVFRTETAYYQQYRESFFGVTMRKAGWDSMRHHEIVSQGTAPLFLDLEACPAWTLHKLPRASLLELRRLWERDPQMVSAEVGPRYRALMRDLFAYYKRTFTTIALAEYVLATVASSASLDTAGQWPLALSTRRLWARLSWKWATWSMGRRGNTQK